MVLTVLVGFVVLYWVQEKESRSWYRIDRLRLLASWLDSMRGPVLQASRKQIPLDCYLRDMEDCWLLDRIPPMEMPFAAHLEETLE